MEKSSSPSTDKIDGETPVAVHATVSHHDAKDTLTTDALHSEHDLTLKDVFKNHKILVWWCFYWAMGAVGWGFDAQINGAMIGVAAFRRDFGYVLDGEAILPADWQTAFNAISVVGQFFGGFIASDLADRMGRRSAHAIGITICAAGAIGEVASTTRVAFLFSKLIIGLGLGFYLTLAPLMASELAPVALRGYASAGINLGIALGQLISNIVVKAFGERDDRWGYRGPFCTQFAFTIFLGVFLPFSPESPWYLARKGNKEAALKSIRKLFGANYDAEKRLLAVEATIHAESLNVNNEVSDATFLDLFRGTNRLRTVISMGVFVCQHVVGIIFVLGYSTYFFQLAGLDVAKSFDLSIGVTACAVAGNITSWFAVERFGRRPLFLGGMAILAVLLLLIGILDVVPTAGASWGQAVSTVIYAYFYFLTIGAMAFAILGEVSSTVLRAKSMACATAVQAVCGLAMSLAIPYMVNPDQGNLKGKVGFIFGGLSVIGFVGAWFLVPELKGKTFEEIDGLFAAKVPPRKMGSYKAEE